MLQRTDALLWSINERLGGRPGLDLSPVDFSGVVSDLNVIAGIENDEYDELERRAPDDEISGMF